MVEGASQYAGALCGHLTDDLDVSSLLDKVHEGRCVCFKLD